MLDRITATFDDFYSPTALAADRQPPQPTRAFFRYFLQQFRGALYARFLLVAAGSVADAMLPVFVGWTVGMLSTTPPGRLFAEHSGTLLLMLAVVLLRPVFFVADALVRNHALTPNLVDLVRWQSHWHVIRQSWTFFQNDFAGRIGTKVMQAGEAIEMTVNLTIDAVWYAAVFVVVAAIALAGMDPMLLVPVVALARRLRPPLPLDDAERRPHLRGGLRGPLGDDRADGGQLHQHPDAQDLRRRRRGGRLRRRLGHRPRRRLPPADGDLHLELVAPLPAQRAPRRLAVTWIALAAWDAGTMTTAMVATAIPFVLQIMNISGWILEVGSNVFRQIGTARDSMVTIARPLTLVDAPGAGPLVVTRGEIAYDRVGFDYWRGDQGAVVKDFSLTVHPGERIGLVGRSGAGKSTLVNLTLRMFDVAAGAIRIDGQDIREVTQESLRRAIGVVGQDTSLLHRSVRENIKFGRHSASDAEMIEAAKRASVHEVIEALVDPEGRTGYDAHVGERGVKLSGGQRQRIALARVILKDAPILVLDEATSALDSEVEAAIQDTLYRVMQGKTVIAIAHRLSTIAHMDRIVVLDAGRVVEEGTHAEPAGAERPLRPPLEPAVGRLPEPVGQVMPAAFFPDPRLASRREIVQEPPGWASASQAAEKASLSGAGIGLESGWNPACHFLGFWKGFGYRERSWQRPSSSSSVA